MIRSGYIVEDASQQDCLTCGYREYPEKIKDVTTLSDKKDCVYFFFPFSFFYYSMLSLSEPHSVRVHWVVFPQRAAPIWYILNLRSYYLIWVVTNHFAFSSNKTKSHSMLSHHTYSSTNPNILSLLVSSRGLSVNFQKFSNMGSNDGEESAYSEAALVH